MRRLRTIRPYSDPIFGTQLDSFPALRHFFKCEETSGNSLRCAKTGLIWTPHELDFDPSIKTVQPNKSYGTYTIDGAISNGSWSQISEDEYLLHVFVLNIQDYGPSGAPTDEERLRVRCRLGYLNTGERYGTSCRGGLHVAVTGDKGNLGWIVATPVTLDISQIGTTVTVISKLTPFAANNTDVTVSIIVLDENGVSIGKSDSRTTASDLPGNITPAAVANWSGGKYYGSAWFAFKNGFPSDVDTAIKWMAASWRSGIRSPYPGWVGII